MENTAIETINDIESFLKKAIIYLKSSDSNLDENTINTLYKIHTNLYEIVDIIDSKLKVPNLRKRESTEREE
ncbi:MAG TPA: hypothetical protein VIP70_09280 [Nitrososphaeraceae archaeon]